MSSDCVANDDRDKVLEGAAEPFAELDEPVAFLLGDDDPLGQFVEEDAVLGFHILDHAGELGVGRSTEESEEWVQESHGADPSFCRCFVGDSVLLVPRRELERGAFSAIVARSRAFVRREPA